jgi:hypothetical protein
MAKDGTPCEYEANEKYYERIYVIMAGILMFILLDLFFCTKTKDDVFEPYYQRLTKAEKE